MGCLTLRVAPPLMCPRSLPRPAACLASHPLPVAFAEPDPHLQTELEECLSEAGLDATPFDKPADLAVAVENGARFALILLDLGAPAGEHLSALRRILESNPSARVLGTTDRDHTGEIAPFMRAGGRDVLTKPLGPSCIPRLLSALPQLARRRTAPLIVGGVMSQLLETVDQIAATGAPALLTGETGVGKGVVARAIHERSPRAARAFVKVLCSAIPGNLLETELFGHARGAFTGAAHEKAGKLELAHRGTLFLDEIGELDLGLQPKLLHALESGELTRVGSNRLRHTDIQLVCATNRDLEEEVAAGRFRADLYHRINVVRLHVPPLRERRDEILPLFRGFIAHWSSLLRRAPPEPSEGLVALIRHHSFPGNARELENLACRFVLFGEQAALHELLSAREAVIETSIDRIVGNARAESGQLEPLLSIRRRVSEVVERELVEQALVTTGWNRRRAARLLQLSYATLLQKIQDFSLAPPEQLCDG